MDFPDLQTHQTYRNPGIELRIAQATSYGGVDIVRILQSYIFQEINATYFKQPHFSYQREGMTVHSEFLIRARDNTLMGRIDYKDSKLMVPSMTILLRNGRTIVIVYKTEKVSGYSKKRDWRNQKNVARFFEDITGVLEQEVTNSYAGYLEQQRKDEIPFHRKREEEMGTIMEAALSVPRASLAGKKKHFLKQKRP